MKTLAVDCRMAHMSGLGAYLRNILPCCMAAMPDVHFRLLGYDGSFPFPPGVKWNALPFDAPVYSIGEQYKVLPLLKGCDAFWTPHYPVPLFTGLPMIATIHDLAHLALRDLYRGAKRLYAKTMFQAVRRKAAELLFVSEFTRQEFLRYVGEQRGNGTVVHNGIDALWLELPFREMKKPPYFLAVGNLKPHKNLRLLCRAFAKTAGRHDAKLLLVGEHQGFRVGESLDYLMGICPGRIEFTGFLPQKDLAALLSEAAALVFPSRYEGFGLPLLEALGAGVPVITSNTEIAREVCSNFVEYFPLNAEERLSKSLLEALVLSPDERYRKAKRGRIWASRFTWEKTAKATVPVLRRALAT